MPADETAPLREALALSPENVPLRCHLAHVLLDARRFTESEAEYKTALGYDAQNPTALIGLAGCYHLQGKHSIATVLFEQIFALPVLPAEAYLLAARHNLATGHAKEAVDAFRLGVEQDPTCYDEELAEALGIDADPRQSEVVDGKMRAMVGEDDGEDLIEEMERPKICFSDVGGMESLKEEIRLKIIHPLKNSDLYAAYGKAVGGGILLYGPPGCGKTLMAKATAGEIGAGFLSVGLHDVLDMWIGSSEKHLHGIFEQARQCHPSVLFFDEVDALAASRSDMRRSGGRHLINQFLHELDGVDTNNDGLLTLAATNAPWHLDAAFRRPGRFDRILFVPPPDGPARAAILHLLLQGKPCEGIEYGKVAKKAVDFSGADLAKLVDLAVEDALQEAMKTGTPPPLTTRRLLKVLKQVKPSTKEWFATARNYALYSNEGGLYDDILTYLGIKK